MAWVKPIYDRTEQDIRERTSKAFLNEWDANRLESNLEYLAVQLGLSYSKHTWYAWNFLEPYVFKRWRDALIQIRQSGIPLPTSPAVPDAPWVHYQQWNDVEKLLYDLKTMDDNIHKDPVYAGEQYSGETIGVI